MTKSSTPVGETSRRASLPTHSGIYNRDHLIQLCPIKAPTQLLIGGENREIDNYNIFAD